MRTHSRPEQYSREVEPAKDGSGLELTTLVLVRRDRQRQWKDKLDDPPDEDKRQLQSSCHKDVGPCFAVGTLAVGDVSIVVTGCSESWSES
ncbi:hypothetical protein Tco_0550245 [Tanacetum coccineum]